MLKKTVFVALCFFCFIFSPIVSASSFRDTGEESWKIRYGDAGMQAKMNQAYLENKMQGMEKTPADYYKLGRLAFFLSQFDQAASLLSAYQQVSSQKDEAAAAHKDAGFFLSLSLARSGKTEQARSIARDMPASWRKDYAMGMICEKENLPKKAAEYYLHACKDEEEGLGVAGRRLFRLEDKKLPKRLARQCRKYRGLSARKKDVPFYRERRAAYREARDWYVTTKAIQLPGIGILY